MEPAPAAEAPTRLASTVLLLRDGDTGLEVFMVVRHHEIDFASGALVFPGGSIDPGDHALAGAPAIASPEDGGSAELTALRIGAIRETFEECGILLARHRGEQDLVPRHFVDAIGAEARADFTAMVGKHDLVPALDRLEHFAHWVTPEGLPKRFDTHFFLAAAPADQIAAHDGNESVDLIWINPSRALEDAKAGRFTIIFPTRLNLQRLAMAGTVDEAFAQARANTIVTVMPQIIREGGVRRLRIPFAAGYGGELFEV